MENDNIEYEDDFESLSSEEQFATPEARSRRTSGVLRQLSRKTSAVAEVTSSVGPTGGSLARLVSSFILRRSSSQREAQLAPDRALPVAEPVSRTEKATSASQQPAALQPDQNPSSSRAEQTQPAEEPPLSSKALHEADDSSTLASDPADTHNSIAEHAEPLASLHMTHEQPTLEAPQKEANTLSDSPTSAVSSPRGASGHEPEADHTDPDEPQPDIEAYADVKPEEEVEPELAASKASLVSSTSSRSVATDSRPPAAAGGEKAPERHSTVLPPFHSWPFASAHQATPSHDTPADHPCPPTPLAPSDRAEPQKPRYSKHTASSHRRVTLAAQDRPQSASPTGNSRPSFSLADARPSTAPTAQQDDMDITLSKGMGPAPRDADCQHDDDSPPGVSHRMSQRAQSELGAGPSNQSLSRSGMRMPGTQERLEAAMRQQLAYPVEQWGIVEVSNWLEFIGLFQYRRAFRQQCIDGATLVELTDAQMRDDLDMTALGHRSLLRRAVAELLEASQPEPDGRHSAGSSPGRDAHHCSSPRPHTAPCATLRAYDVERELAVQQHAKLYDRLVKAKSSAVRRMNFAGDADKMVKVALEEVRQLHGELDLLERKFHLAQSETSVALGLSPRDVTDPRELMGSVPWYPSGHHLVTHIERPVSNVLAESTFHPELTQNTLRIIEGDRPAFLDRQLADLRSRKHRDQMTRRHWYNRERYGSNPLTSLRALEKDLNFLREHLPTVGCTALGSPSDSLTRPPREDQQLHAATCSPCDDAESALARSLRGSQSPRRSMQSSLASPRSLLRPFSPRASPRTHASPLSSPRSRIKRTESLRGAIKARHVSQGGLAGLGEELDEAVDSFAAELQLSEQQVEAVHKAKGRAKVHKLASIVQTKQFLQRYKQDLSERPGRRKQEADHWFRRESFSGFIPLGGKPQAQQLVSSKGASFRLSPTAPKPKDPFTRAAEEAACMRRHLLACGWPKDELEGSMADSSPRVEQLVERARILQAARLDYTSKGQPDLPDDGLEQLQVEHTMHMEALHDPPPPQYDSYMPPEDSTQPAAEEPEDESSPLLTGPAPPLEQTLQLLQACHRRDLDELDHTPPSRRCLALYRLLAKQRYLERVQQDLSQRDERTEANNLATFPSKGPTMTEAERKAFIKKLEAYAAARKRRGQELFEEVRRMEGHMLESGREELRRTLARSATKKT